MCLFADAALGGLVEGRRCGASGCGWESMGGSEAVVSASNRFGCFAENLLFVAHFGQDFQESGVVSARRTVSKVSGKRGLPGLCRSQALRSSGSLGFWLGLWDEDDLDVLPLDVRVLPRADGERRDGSCCGLGQQCGPSRSPVDVVLLDGD